ncbi:MAG: hypothetical protein R1F54_02695 [Candidatus Zeuxoniibacter abyssi]|nr:MAG: hypothetical protein R1F54_02695 [Candidatus Persebacteraceae bacterium AB1(2)]
MEQRHLNYVDRVNLGGYYTPVHYVALAWKMLSSFLDGKTVILDCACGYGAFLEKSTDNITIGCDIDKVAVNTARENNPQAVIFHANALQNVSREKFNIPVGDKLAIIGNPPYNDRTSIIRQNIKSSNFSIDAHIATRDLGMSFLLSYNALCANYVCVLHPLSYLIKQSNFNLLKKFTSNYKLKEGLIISSEVFSQSSKTIKFPIVIALYERDDAGMDYHYIRGFKFKTVEGKCFSQNDFDYISKEGLI